MARKQTPLRLKLTRRQAQAMRLAPRRPLPRPPDGKPAAPPAEGKPR
jgi:hypothetical protein